LIARPAIAEDQQPVAGGGGVHVPGAGVFHHSAGQVLYLSAQGSFGGIERLRHQLAATHEQEKAIGVDGVRLG
jgi:hypothetical protein